MGIIELYSSIAPGTIQSDHDNVVDDVAMNRAEVQRIADLQDHTTYQVMEVYKLINTLKCCGVDRSILFMYNKNNELSKLSGVVLPSLEDYDNGSRVSDKDINTMISNICENAGIVAMEGNQFGDFFKAYYDDFLKPFRAGWRWFQSMSTEPTKLAGRIESYIENLKANQRTKLSGKAEIIAFNTLKRHLSNKTTEYRKEANKLIKELNAGHVSLEESVDGADRMREIRDEVRSNINDIKGSTRASSRIYTDLSKISISDYIKLGEQTIERLKEISKMNETYDGFWYTGYSTGKLHYIFSSLANSFVALAGTIVESNVMYAASVYLHRGVISTVSVGWQVLTLTVDADMVLARAIAHNLKEINDAIK